MMHEVTTIDDLPQFRRFIGDAAGPEDAISSIGVHRYERQKDWPAYRCVSVTAEQYGEQRWRVVARYHANALTLGVASEILRHMVREGKFDGELRACIEVLLMAAVGPTTVED